MYVRKLVFIASYYFLVEMVEKKTWDPITTVIINIHTGKYASLGNWYTDISGENDVVLKNRFDGNSLTLKGVDDLNWINIE